MKPNHVPAAGEATPKSMPAMTPEFARERIGILGHEIASLLGALPDAEFVAIRQAGKAGSAPVSIGLDINAGFREEVVPENPWMAFRRLSREMSAVLDDCDGGRWSAVVEPAATDRFEQRKRRPHPDDAESAIDRVERLAGKLSHALSDYAGATFQALVMPSSVAGAAVMFSKISTWDGRASR